MLFRYRARNFPETLNLDEARAWNKDRKARLKETSDPAYFTLNEFQLAMQEMREAKKDDAEAQRILDQLDAWVLEIGLSDL